MRGGRSIVGFSGNDPCRSTALIDAMTVGTSRSASDVCDLGCVLGALADACRCEADFFLLLERWACSADGDSIDF